MGTIECALIVLSSNISFFCVRKTDTQTRKSSQETVTVMYYTCYNSNNSHGQTYVCILTTKSDATHSYRQTQWMCYSFSASFIQCLKVYAVKDNENVLTMAVGNYLISIIF